MISEWDREGDLENRRNNETILPFPVCNVPREPSPLRGTCKINPDNAYPCMFLKNSDPLS